jgi:hypothetical protein
MQAGSGTAPEHGNYIPCMIRPYVGLVGFADELDVFYKEVTNLLIQVLLPDADEATIFTLSARTRVESGIDSNPQCTKFYVPSATNLNTHTVTGRELLTCTCKRARGAANQKTMCGHKLAVYVQHITSYEALGSALMRYARTPTSNNAQSNMQDAYRARGGEVGDSERFWQERIRGDKTKDKNG